METGRRSLGFVRVVVPRTKVQAALFGAVLAGSAIAGVSYASIPDGSGAIHGCYTDASPHVLRVIDTAKTPKCPAETTAINWNQTGPQGPQGASGPQGPSGLGGVTGLQEFTASNSWTAPVGVSHVLIEAAGGGGGGALANPSCTNLASGQPGGLGGYVETVVPVTPSEVYTVQVGVGGMGAPLNGAATSGTDSELIGPSSTVLADAGGGGAGANPDLAVTRR